MKLLSHLKCPDKEYACLHVGEVKFCEENGDKYISVSLINCAPQGVATASLEVVCERADGSALPSARKVWKEDIATGESRSEIVIPVDKDTVSGAVMIRTVMYSDLTTQEYGTAFRFATDEEISRRVALLLAGQTLEAAPAVRPTAATVPATASTTAASTTTVPLSAAKKTTCLSVQPMIEGEKERKRDPAAGPKAGKMKNIIWTVCWLVLSAVYILIVPLAITWMNDDWFAVGFISCCFSLFLLAVVFGTVHFKKAGYSKYGFFTCAATFAFIGYPIWEILYDYTDWSEMPCLTVSLLAFFVSAVFAILFLIANRKKIAFPIVTLSLTLLMACLAIAMFSEEIGFPQRGKDAPMWLEDVEAGDSLYFGAYGGERIEWRVLETRDGYALVISEYALDARSYNSSAYGTTWEDSSLRQWLNQEFVSDCFDKSTIEFIAITTVTAERYTERSEWTTPGYDVSDRVFLLSASEADTYFDSDDDRVCQPLPYALEHYNGYCIWWLRNTGYNQNEAMAVNDDGTFGSYRTEEDSVWVRPAMWVDLKILSAPDCELVTKNDSDFYETEEYREQEQKEIEPAMILGVKHTRKCCFYTNAGIMKTPQI